MKLSEAEAHTNFKRGAGRGSTHTHVQAWRGANAYQRGAGENAFYIYVNVVVELLEMAYCFGSASSLAWSGTHIR